MTRQDARTYPVDARMAPTSESPGDLPSAFRTLWLVVFINRLGSFVVPFLALFLTDGRQMSITRVGAVVALFGAGATVAGPLGGALADRLGRRRAIALGLGLSAGSMVHVTLARSPLHLFVAVFLLGLCADLSRPATNAAIADLVPPERRARAFAHLYWAANLGFAFSSVAAGWLASVRFELCFYGDALSSVLALVLVLLRLPESRPTHDERPRLSQLVVPLADRAFLPLFAVSLLVSLVFMQFHSTLPLDLRAHGLGARTFGALAALNCTLVVVLQPLTVRVAGALRPTAALAVGALLTGAGFGSFAIAHSLPGYVMGVAVLTLGEIAMAPAVPALIAELAPAHLRGTYQGTFGMSFSVAACLAPLLGSRALDALGSGWLWSMSLVGGSVAALLYMLLRARLVRAEAHARATTRRAARKARSVAISAA